MSDEAPIEANLAELRARIQSAAQRCGRDPAALELIGVCKRKPAALAARAVRAGLRALGENYLQEARDKIPAVASLLAAQGCPAPRWHLVGRLQRNKVRDAARDFDVIETLDRAELGDALDQRAGEIGRRLSVLIQVNTSGEAQKGGVAPAQAAALLALSERWAQLDVIGLMTVPAASADPEASRAAFRRLRELREDLQRRPGGSRLAQLSMGMSADFEVAVEEGATWLRIGTALFGARST